MLQVTPVPALSDNYVWLIHGLTDANKVAVVDPGEAGPVAAACADLGLQPVAVLITHHHWDHVGGIGALVQQFEVPVYGPARERIPGCTHPLSDGDRVSLDELSVEFSAVETPGHTAGQIAYVGHGALFSGDTLFSAGCGRLFEGTPAQMVASLGKLARLAPDTKVYCGHEYTVNNLRFSLTVEPDNVDAQDYLEKAGNQRRQGEPTLPSTMELELKVNPFLRCTEPGVRKSAEERTGRSLNDEVEVFAAVRRWKDSF